MLRKTNKKQIQKYADLIRKVCLEVNDERGSKCGYDLMMGMTKYDANLRAKAWEEFLKEHAGGDNVDSVDEERDGVWVPAISENMKSGKIDNGHKT